MRRWAVAFFLAVLAGTVFSAQSQRGQEPFWLMAANGLRNPDDVPLYRQTGMTVLWVTVFYRNDGDLSGYDALLTAADRANLPYIIALDVCPPRSLRPRLRCAPHDADYVAWLRRWLDIVVTHFRTRSNLLGYAVGGAVDESVSYDDAGFALFLQRQYGTLEQLRQTWQLPVQTWQIPQLWALQADDGQSPLRYGRPSLDVALYRWVTLRNLFVLWADELRRRDPQRWLIAGPLTTYRSLAVVPPSYDAIVPYLSPEQAEPDWLTHNCHAVAIARRGGRFRAVPMLTTRLKDGRTVTAETLWRWAVVGAMQGATGFVLSDWSALKENEALRVNVSALAYRLRTEVPADAAPQSQTAILYTPFAEGVLTANGFPLYGFAIAHGNQQAFPLRLGVNEPGSLFWWLRFHPWGTVDSLTPEELTPDFVSRYRMLLAPMPAYLDAPMQMTLANFVQSGGVLVADFGVGAFQSEAPFLAMPRGLWELFGVPLLRQVLFNGQLRTGLTVYAPHALFPDLPAGTELGSPQGSFGIILGFAVGFRAQPWAIALATRTARRALRDSDRSRTVPGPAQIAGLFINPFGRGYALFASTLLWALWSPHDPGFVRFHADLLGRFAPMQVMDLRFPPSAWISPTQRGIWVVNPTAQPMTTRLQVRAPIFYAYNDATVRPLEGVPARQEVSVPLRGGDWVFLRPVAEVAPPTAVQVERLTPEIVTLRLDAPTHTQIALRLITDRYRLSARRHRVTIATPQGTDERTVEPDRWGFVAVDRVPVPSTVTVTPAP
ncbi:hypothetical protein HRbin17_02339 [bacterium HR17]|uniref:Glycoside hydrolase family 42 N-terminal domain-containing protein n=1 Tax=Candidatus Fervidibacter japonicus TaxID=2035412 RepID=A0A2H5XF36_9BACT|nr:hypothetical protein HRbin17_02339 [bacterium HR17]